MEDRALPPAPEDEDEGRSVLARLLLWFGFGLASLALFAAALVVVLDTGPGRRFVADQIQRVALGSGLRISIGRIEGSIYGRLTLRDVRLSDPDGMFADSPQLKVDWPPAAWLAHRLHATDVNPPPNPP